MPSNGREELCRIALAIAELGVSAPEYIAYRLRVPLHRVRSALAMMESFGWIERVEADKSACPCSKCPLRKICPVAGRAEKIPLYRVKKEVLEYCKRLIDNSKGK